MSSRLGKLLLRRGLLSRVRTSGGPIELLHPTPAVDVPVWSPDGRTIAILASLEGRAVGRKIVLVSPGAPTRYLDAAADADNLRFTPDGSAVSYLARKAGTMSIHVQPLDGSAPRLMAAPDDAANAQVSPDGSQIAVLRSRNDSDVVLLRDSAPPRR